MIDACEDEYADMKDRPIIKLIIAQVQFTCLLIEYIYLRIRYVELHIRLYLLKAAGALLIEAVKLEGFIKSLSKEDRVIFAACISISIFTLARFMFIRI